MQFKCPSFSTARQSHASGGGGGCSSTNSPCEESQGAHLNSRASACDVRTGTSCEPAEARGGELRLAGSCVLLAPLRLLVLRTVGVMVELPLLLRATLRWVCPVELAFLTLLPANEKLQLVSSRLRRSVCVASF